MLNSILYLTTKAARVEVRSTLFPPRRHPRSHPKQPGSNGSAPGCNTFVTCASRTHSLDNLGHTGRLTAERKRELLVHSLLLLPTGRAIWGIWQSLKHLSSFVCLKDDLELFVLPMFHMSGSAFREIFLVS